MIYVTHDQIEAMTLADRIVVLRAGPDRAGRHPARPLQPPGQPLRRRLHRRARDELPRRRGEVHAGRTRQPPPPGIRPQHLRLAAPGAAGGIAAEVALVEALGTETVVHAATGPASASSPSSPARPPLAGRPRIALAGAASDPSTALVSTPPAAEL